MDRFTTILWDVDGTLLDFVYAQRHSLQKCFETIGREITDEILECYARINDGYWKRLELGEVTKEELFIGRFRDFLKACAMPDVDAHAMAQEYHEHLGGVYRLIDGSLELCKRLQGRVRQYVVTNGFAGTQTRKLKLSGFYDIMDGIFISEEVGASKPQKEFFDYCLERIAEKDRRKILLVGDSLSSDIRGGVQAGIATCWYRPERIDSSMEHPVENPSPWRPDYEIGDLRQVEGLLEGLLEGTCQNHRDRS